jgi:uncharacterized protein (TIGR00730 family)
MSSLNYNNPNEHPSNLLAIDDRDFLTRTEMRGMRLALEYEKPERSLTDWGIKSTLSVFGSARIKEESEIEYTLNDLKKSHADKSEIIKHENLLSLSKYYEDARAFARLASINGGAMNPYGRNRYNVITSGAGPGIMEATNRGAADVGAPNIGFGIELPFESGNNNFITPGLSFQFHYFAVRKFHMMQRASSIVVFPGGLGSLDELAEAMTLRQTKKSHDYKILLYGTEFWNNTVNLEYLVDNGMISNSDLELIMFADHPEEAWYKLVDANLYIPNL